MLIYIYGGTLIPRECDISFRPFIRANEGFVNIAIAYVAKGL